jgi:hypothetical protein
MSCSYWDESAQQWAFDGIESSLSENTLSCASTHLTTFGGILQINPYVEPLKPTTGLYNTISLDDASEFLEAFVIADNITVTAIVGTMLCANLLSLFWYGWYRGYRARRRRAKLGKSFEGKTLVESQIRQNYSLNIVALQKRVPYITEEGRAAYRVVINDSPLPMDVIEADDIVVLVGSEKNLDRLFHDLEEV